MEYDINNETRKRSCKYGKINETLGAMCFILVVPIVNILYSILDNPGRGAFNLQTSIDRAIPFLKIFIIPYIAWYPYILLSLLFLCIKDRKTYYKTLMSLQLGLIFCYIIYFFFQTTVPRPEIYSRDILSKLVLFIYRTDKPYNCFPSIHVLSCIILVRGALKNYRRSAVSIVLITLISSLIIVSTLLVKQHVILDILSAMLLGNITFDLIDILERKLTRVKEVNADRTVLDFISIKLKNAALDKVMPVITWCNNYGQVYIIFAFLEAKKNHANNLAKMIIAALLIEVTLCELIIKPIFKRHRPITCLNCDEKSLVKKPKSYSFPSGHTASSFVVVSVAWSMNSNYKYLILVVAVLVSFSRIYLRLHYPSDIAIGILLGLMLGKITVYTFAHLGIIDKYYNEHTKIWLPIAVLLCTSISLAILINNNLRLNKGLEP